MNPTIILLVLAGYAAYLFILFRNNSYMRTAHEHLRPFILRRRVWNGLALGPLIWFVYELLTPPSFLPFTIIHYVSLICMPAPFWVFFCLIMAWRNAVGMRNERRHLMMIAALERMARKGS